MKKTEILTQRLRDLAKTYPPRAPRLQSRRVGVMPSRKADVHGKGSGRTYWDIREIHVHPGLARLPADSPDLACLLLHELVHAWGPKGHGKKYIDRFQPMAKMAGRRGEVDIASQLEDEIKTLRAIIPVLACTVYEGIEDGVRDWDPPTWNSVRREVCEESGIALSELESLYPRCRAVFKQAKVDKRRDDADRKRATPWLSWLDSSSSTSFTEAPRSPCSSHSWRWPAWPSPASAPSPRSGSACSPVHPLDLSAGAS